MPIARYDCPHCGMRAMTHTLMAEIALPAGCFDVFARCGGCDRGSIAGFGRKGGKGNISPSGCQLINDHFDLLGVTPDRPTPIAPKGVPEAVAKRFVEAEGSFHDRRWNSAATMYRSVLDIATKQLAPGLNDGNFASRLKKMVEKGLMPNAMGAWANAVREEGNAAVHSDEEADEHIVANLRHFTQMFLTYAYEMPKRVADYGGPVDEFEALLKDAN